MSFDRVVLTKNGFVTRIKISVIHSPIVNNTIGSLNATKCIEINKFHIVIGRCGIVQLKGRVNIEKIAILLS